MKGASEYRQHAQECRALAKELYGERRQSALEMAETWEDLARQVDSANNRHLAGMLKAIYDNVASEQVPATIENLLKRLASVEKRRR